MGQEDKPLFWVGSSIQKKSKHGIATPKPDMDIIRAWLKLAEALAEELGNEEARD